MANIGELSIGLLFDVNEGNLQANIRQAQQMASRGIVIKPVFEDTDLQRRIQASVGIIERTEQESRGRRIAGMNEYARMYKSLLDDQKRDAKNAENERINLVLESVRVQKAANEEVAKANRKAAIDAKNAENERINLVLESVRVQKAANQELVNAQKAADRAAAESATAAAAQRAEALNQVKLAHTRLQSAYAEELRSATNWRDRVSAAQNYRTALNGVETELRNLTTQANVTTRELLEMEVVQKRINNERLKLSGVNNPLSGLGNAEGLSNIAPILSTLSPSLGAAAMNGSMVAQSFTSILGVSGPMALGLGAAALAVAGVGKAMGEAVNKAADFEQGMKGITSIQQMTGAEANGLARNFQKLSTELPVTTEQITGIARNAVLMGVEGSESIEQFTRSVAMLGVATRENNKQFGDMSVMSEHIAVFLNETGSTAKTFSKDMDSVVATLAAVDQVTPGTINGVLNLTRYMAAGSVTLNLNREAILGIAGALSGLGANAEGGGSAVIRVLMAMNRAANGSSKQLDDLGGKLGMTKQEMSELFSGDASSKLEAFARVMGVSADEAKRLIDTKPEQAFLLLSEGLNKAHESGQNMTQILDELGLKNVRDIRLVDQMTVGHNLLAKSIDASSNSEKNRAALQERTAKATDNFNDAMAKAKNATTVFLQTAGEPMLKWLTSLANGWVTAMNKASDYFAKLNQHNEERHQESDLAVAQSDLTRQEGAAARYRATLSDPKASERDVAIAKIQLPKVEADIVRLRAEITRLGAIVAENNPKTPVKTTPNTGPLSTPGAPQPLKGAGPLLPGQSRAGQVAGLAQLQMFLGMAGRNRGTPYGETYGPNGSWGKHVGEDFFAAPGTPIYAPFTGEARLRQDKQQGNIVDLYDVNGMRLTMIHLKGYADDFAKAVKDAGGKLKVEQGTLLAYVGQTGLAAHADLGVKNSHLHVHAYDQNGLTNVGNVTWRGMDAAGAWRGAGSHELAPENTTASTNPNKNPNAQLEKQLAEAHHLLNQYRAAVASGNEAWITKAETAVNTWRTKTKIWNKDLQKELEDIKKGGPADLTVTDTQIAKARELLATYQKAQQAAVAQPNNNKLAVIATNAKTAMDTWTQVSARNAKAMSEVESLQTIVNKKTAAYVPTAKEMNAYRAKGLELATRLAQAEASGSDTQSRAAKAAIQSWLTGTKEEVRAKTAVLDIEKQTLKANQQKQVSLEQQARRQRDFVAQLNKDLDAGKIPAAQAAAAKMEQQLKTTLAMYKDNAQERLRVENTLGKQVLAAQKRVLEAQEAQELAANKALFQKRRNDAYDLYKLTGKNRQLANLPADVREKLSAAAEQAAASTIETNYATKNSELYSQFQERVNNATATVDAKTKQQADAALATQKQVNEQLASLNKEQRDNAIQSAQNVLKGLESSRNKRIKDAGDDAAKVLKIEKDTADQIRMQRVNVAYMQWQNATMTAQEKFNTTTSPEALTGKTAAQQAQIKAAAQKVLNSANANATSDMGVAVQEAFDGAAESVADAQGKLDDFNAKQQKNIDSLAKSYRELNDRINQQVQEGKFDDEAKRQALQTFNDLTRQSNEYGLTQNKIVASTRAATYAIIENGQANSDAFNENQSRLADWVTEWQKADDQLGDFGDNASDLYGILQDLIDQDKDPRESGYVQLLDEIISKGGEAGKTAQWVKDNLDQLEADGGGNSLAAIAYRGKKAIQDARDANDAEIPQDPGTALHLANVSERWGTAVDEALYQPEDVAEKILRAVKLVNGGLHDVTTEQIEKATELKSKPEWDTLSDEKKRGVNDILNAGLWNDITDDDKQGFIDHIMDFSDSDFESIDAVFLSGLMQDVESNPAFDDLRKRLQSAFQKVTDETSLVARRDNEVGFNRPIGENAGRPDDDQNGRRNDPLAMSPDEVAAAGAAYEGLTKKINENTTAELNNLEVVARATNDTDLLNKVLAEKARRVDDETQALKDKSVIAAQLQLNQLERDEAERRRKNPDSLGSTAYVNERERLQIALENAQYEKDIVGKSGTELENMSRQHEDRLTAIRQQGITDRAGLEKEAGDRAISATEALMNAQEQLGAVMGQRLPAYTNEIRSLDALKAKYPELTKEIDDLIQKYKDLRPAAEKSQMVQDRVKAKNSLNDLFGSLTKPPEEFAAAYDSTADALNKLKEAQPALTKQIDQQLALADHMKALNLPMYYASLTAQAVKAGAALGKMFGSEDAGAIMDDASQGIEAVISGISNGARVAAGDMTAIPGLVMDVVNLMGSVGDIFDRTDETAKNLKKSMLEVAEAEKAAMGSKTIGGSFGQNGWANPYYEALKKDSETLNKKANATFWQKLLWSVTGEPETLRTEVSEQLRTASSIFNEFGQSLYSTIEDTLMNAFDTGDFGGVLANFDKTLNHLVAKMALQTIIAGSRIKDDLKKLSDDVAAHQDTTADVAQIRQDMVDVSTQWQAVSSALPGYGAATAEQVATGNLVGNAPGIQLGIPHIEASLPDSALQSLSDLAGVMPDFVRAVDKLGSMADKNTEPGRMSEIQVSFPPAVFQPLLDFGATIPILDQASRRLLVVADKFESALSGNGLPPQHLGSGLT